MQIEGLIIGVAWTFDIYVILTKAAVAVNHLHPTKDVSD